MKSLWCREGDFFLRNVAVLPFDQLKQREGFLVKIRCRFGACLSNTFRCIKMQHQTFAWFLFNFSWVESQRNIAVSISNATLISWSTSISKIWIFAQKKWCKWRVRLMKILKFFNLPTKGQRWPLLAQQGHKKLCGLTGQFTVGIQTRTLLGTFFIIFFHLSERSHLTSVQRDSQEFLRLHCVHFQNFRSCGEERRLAPGA